MILHFHQNRVCIILAFLPSLYGIMCTSTCHGIFLFAVFILGGLNHGLFSGAKIKDPTVD